MRECEVDEPDADRQWESHVQSRVLLGLGAIALQNLPIRGLNRLLFVFEALENIRADLGFERGKLGTVGRGVGIVGRGVNRIEFHERLADVLHVNHRIARRHPRMRIRLPHIGPFVDADRRDAIRQHRARHIFQVAEKPLEPPLEVEAVP